MSLKQTITADCIIHARWIIPVEPHARVLNYHSLVIKDRRIADVLDTDSARAKYQSKLNYELENHALIPGLINTHGHAAMTLFRGLADDLDLMNWLNNHIWPAEKRWISEEFVLTGTELAIAEMLLGGTTCFADMYFYPNSVAKAAHRHKIRAHIFVPIIEYSSSWAANADEYFHKGLKIYDDYRNHELIRVGLGPHAPYTVSNASLQRTRMLADELDAPVQIHLHETAKEIADSVAEFGCRPIQRLDDLDLLSQRILCVHMTQINQEEIAVLAQTGAQIVHCPQSNLKLASGFCPVKDYLDAGINVALGTDGAASNNDLSMLSEAQSAALLAKGVTQDPTAVTAYEALRMATINGAKALGEEKRIGSIEIGKAADIVAIDLSELPHQPIYDPVSHLIYTNSDKSVSHVWINGQTVVSGGELENFDTAGLAQRVAEWRKKIGAAENQQTLKF